MSFKEHFKPENIMKYIFIGAISFIGSEFSRNIYKKYQDSKSDDNVNI